MATHDSSQGSLKERFKKDGVCGPIPVLDSSTSAELLKQLTIFREGSRICGGEIEWNRLETKPWENPPVSPVEEMLLSLAQNPSVINAIVAAMGPDVFLRNIDVFWKDPVPWAWAKNAPWAPREEIDWHCDEPTSEASGQVGTLWLALTHAEPLSGGIVYRPGSHRTTLRKPVTEIDGLSFDEEQLADIRDTPEWFPCLQPGEGLLHEGNVVHRSSSNRSLHPRVGIAFRFASGALSSDVAGASTGLLLSGTMSKAIQKRVRVPIQWWHTDESPSGEAESEAKNPIWFDVEMQGIQMENADHVAVDWGLLCGDGSQSIYGWSDVKEAHFAVFKRTEEMTPDSLKESPVHAGALPMEQLHREGTWRRGRGWWSDTVCFRPEHKTDYILRIILFLEDDRVGWRDLLIPLSDR